MNPLAYIMMLGWPIVTAALFVALPARRAALIALISGWLLLPNGVVAFRGLPEYTKLTAVCVPIVLCTAGFAPALFGRLRFRFYDVPMLLWCVVPLASSLSNGLGLYDGVSGVVEHSANWGCAYLVGRLHFSSLAGLRELAVGVVVGALAYVPLCLWEMRMSPTLHQNLYGFITFKFLTTMRFGGYRPVVFMQHGIALGLWMVMAACLAWWLRRQRVLGLPGSGAWKAAVVILIVVALLTRSLGAVAAGVLCGGLLLLADALQRRWPLGVMALIPVVYLGAALTDTLPREAMVDLAAHISPDRAESLYGRLYHEAQLVDKALERPLLGWGGWGRNRITNDQGENVSVTDGLWIIAFGQFGVVGLAGIFGCYLLPGLLLIRCPRSFIRHPAFAPAIGLAVLLNARAMDALMNGFPNPVFLAASGGLLPCIEACRLAARAHRRPAPMVAEYAPAGGLSRPRWSRPGSCDVGG